MSIKGNDVDGGIDITFIAFLTIVICNTTLNFDKSINIYLHEHRLLTFGQRPVLLVRVKPSFNKKFEQPQPHVL